MPFIKNLSIFARKVVSVIDTTPRPFVSTSFNRTLLIKTTGRVFGWGANSNGQVGDGTISSRTTPVSVAGAVKTFCEISAGVSHSMAIDKNGRAWGWGNNSGGPLGDGTISSRTTPVSVAGAVKTFCEISAGNTFTIAIDKNGRAWGWGSGGNGRLGNNSSASQLTPITVGGLTKTFCQISAGGFTTIAIDRYGRAWGWGFNGSGQVGNGTVLQASTPVSVAGAIKTFCKISHGIEGSGTSHSLAIDRYGRAWGWGNNGSGRLGNNSTTNQCTPVSVVGTTKTFCQISAGTAHSLAIDRYGRVWSWGFGSSGQLGNNATVSQLTPVSVLGAVKTFCQITSGTTNSIAVDKNGLVWAWGSFLDGALGNNTPPSTITPLSVRGQVRTFCQITAGYQFSISIDKNGRAWGWGNNTAGRIGDGSITERCTPVSIAGAARTFCRIDSGDSHSLAIDRNGRAWGWGQNSGGSLGDTSATSRLTPVSVAGAVKTFCQISAGTAMSIAIDRYGRAWGWGTNSQFRLGVGSAATFIFTPMSIIGTVRTFCRISSGDAHTLAIDRYGRAWGWGLGIAGRLGNNSTVSQTSPVCVCGTVKTFCQISASSHGLAIDRYGRVWSWGFGSSGQLGNNATVSQLTPVSVLGAVKTFCQISAGTSYSVAIDKNGRAWGWGSNTDGSLGNNSTTNQCTPVSVVGTTKTFCQISAGENFTIAIDKNGRSWAWGTISNSRLGIGIGNALTPIRVCTL